MLRLAVLLVVVVFTQALTAETPSDHTNSFAARAVFPDVARPVGVCQTTRYAECDPAPSAQCCVSGGSWRCARHAHSAACPAAPDCVFNETSTWRCIPSTA